MPKTMTVQEAVELVRETDDLPDIDSMQHWWQEDGWRSLVASLHQVIIGDSENINIPYLKLPDARGEMMRANRAHLMIILREAGAGRDPFGPEEWTTTPAKVCQNLTTVQQLPTLTGADLANTNLSWSNLKGVDLSHDDMHDNGVRFFNVDPGHAITDGAIGLEV